MSKTTGLLMELLISAGIPTATVGFGIWWIQHKIECKEAEDNAKRQARQKEIDERDAAREKSELYMVKSIGAAMALCEATAKAVQRIPDAHCNGDMHAALEYAEKIKHEQKDFLQEQALKNIY